MSNFDATTNPPVLDVSQSNEFEYKENIQALYVNSSKKNKFKTKFTIRFKNRKYGYNRFLEDNKSNK